MKITNKRPVWTQDALNHLMAAGWNQASINGRAGLTPMVATTKTMALLKESDGTMTLVPYARILDFYPTDEVTA